MGRSMWRHIRPKGVGRYECQPPDGGDWQPTTIHLIERSLGGKSACRDLRAGNILTSERGWKYRYVEPVSEPLPPL